MPCWCRRPVPARRRRSRLRRARRRGARRRPGGSDRRRSRGRSRRRRAFRACSSARALGAVAGGAMSGPAEAGVAGDVHVQQVARARPLVAVRRLARGLGRRESPARLSPSRRRVDCWSPGDQTRPPTGRLGDPRRSAPRARRRQPRLVLRPAGAIAQPLPSARACADALRQRCHQLCAVPDETLIAAAAARIEIHPRLLKPVAIDRPIRASR